MKILSNYFMSSVAFQDFLGGSDSKEFACSAGDLCLIPRLERSSGEGTAPVFCPGDSIDWGSCQATVHGVTKRQTPLSDFYFHKIFILLWFSDNKFENVGHFQWNCWFIGISSMLLPISKPFSQIIESIYTAMRSE